MENVTIYSENNFEKIKEVWCSTNAEDKFEKILNQLKILKDETSSSLQKKFCDNEEVTRKAIEKNENNKKLFAMCEDLEKKLLQQKATITELKSVEQEQVDAKVFKNEFNQKMLISISEISKMLQKIEQLLSEKNYHEASKILVDVKMKFSVDMMENEVLKSSKIFTFLQRTEQKFKQNITEELKKEMDETISCKHPDNKDIIVVLMFNLKNHNLNELVDSLNHLGLLSNIIEDLGGKMMKYIIKNITRGSAVDVVNDKLVISKQESNTRVGGIEHFKQVCKHLQKFINYIGENLMPYEGGVVLLKGVGSKISTEFLEIITKDILEGQNNDDKKLFEELVGVVQQLKNSASKYHLIDDILLTSDPLIEDASLSYISSKCRHHLILARHILAQPLHQSISAVVDYACDHSLLNGCGDGGELSGGLGGGERGLGGGGGLEDGDRKVLEAPFKNIFVFPDCQISKSIEDYWKNVETMIREVGGLKVVGVDGGRVKLVSFIRHVVDLFSSMAPLLHKDEIENIAYVAALHHNNSFYLAHQLLLLHCKIVALVDNKTNVVDNNKTKDNSNNTSAKDNNNNTKENNKAYGSWWIDTIEDLRRVGMEGLSRLLRDQKEQFETIIRNEAVFSGLNRVDNVEKSERCLRMVNMKLNHMLRSWLHVLPLPLCASNIGALLGVVLKEVLSEITKVEDFAEIDSKKLVVLLGQLHDNSVTLFTSLLNEKRQDDDVDKGWTRNVENKINKNEVLEFLSRNVENWEALLQVRWVLGAGLMDISDRWGGGKGPLAGELSAAEVERLVKALFKNTEMRSQVLNSIKNSS